MITRVGWSLAGVLIWVNGTSLIKEHFWTVVPVSILSFICFYAASEPFDSSETDPDD